MTSVYTGIRAALETKLQAVEDLPEIAWENVDFSPTTGTSYVSPTLLPTLREPAHRGLNPQMRYQGIYIVDCYTPKNEGPATLDDLADKIINAFEATTTVTHYISRDKLLDEDSNYLLLEDGDKLLADSGVINLSIRYVERTGSVSEDAFYTTRVNIGWYLYA